MLSVHFNCCNKVNSGPHCQRRQIKVVLEMSRKLHFIEGGARELQLNKLIRAHLHQ
jgi:hypothetical protein